MRLGIDFGTTHTVVALVDRGNTPVVSFEGGDFVPSFVAVEAATGERRYGWDAFALRHEPGWEVIRSLKRLLDGAGPTTELSIGRWRLPLGALLSEFFSALHREIAESSNAGVTVDEALTVAVSVPANATTAQRFLTLEAFKAGGFTVEALLNEPSAAGFEYAHRYRRAGPKREHLVVYDLGGGTFDASLLRMTGKTNEVVATHGVRRLGGDDFDEAILGLVLERASAGALTGEERALVLEECVVRKESLSPNTRRVHVDLAAIGREPLVLPVDEIYAACAPLVHRSLEAVESLVADPEGGGGIPWSDIAGLYVVGGGALFPLVTRVLKERFGEKRVRRSPHPFAATAMGLAVFLDREAGWALSDRLSRHFGVFRESDAGTDVVFDPIFPKGTALPDVGAAPVTVVRRYRAAHNVGHFRFLECTRLADARPDGDVTPWDEVFVPFERGLREADLARVPIVRSQDGPEIEETYTLGSDGAVSVAVTETSDGFTRTFTLTR
jgi:molecular chaperone DnaK (HSP70)